MCPNSVQEDLGALWECYFYLTQECVSRLQCWFHISSSNSMGKGCRYIRYIRTWSRLWLALADNLGSKTVKPWGNYFSSRQLWYSSNRSPTSVRYWSLLYYIFCSSVIGDSNTGGILFAYNFEAFRVFFHTNFWFSLSWGALPLIAGFVMQTNHIETLPLVFLLSQDW